MSDLSEKLQIITPWSNESDEEEGGKRNKRFVKRTECVRCGSCCMASSPMLVRDDMTLFISNILNDTNTYTVRAGEPLYNRREQEIYFAPFETIKVSEDSGCRLYEGSGVCAIYENRPAQCRDYRCWGTEPPLEGLEDIRVSRAELFGNIKPLYEIILRHEEVCSYDKMADMMASIESGDDSAAQGLLEMLKFDMTTREFLSEGFQISKTAMNLVLGRPMAEVINLFGLELVCDEEGFTLRAIVNPQKTPNE